MNARLPMLCVIAFTPAMALAQDGPASWPPLDVQEALIEGHFDTLRRTKKDDRRIQAEAALIGMGPGVVPELLERMSDARNNANESLVRVMNAVTGREHRHLIALETTHRKAAVRLWAIERLTEFQEPDMAEIFRRARKDEDARIAFRAAIGQLSAGDLDGIGPVFAHARENWPLSPEIVRALPCARGDAGVTAVIELTKNDTDEAAILGGLRLLRWLTPPSAIARIKPFLAMESGPIKREAVNTLRVAVDGDAPLDNPSVFEVIQHARKWEDRSR